MTTEAAKEYKRLYNKNRYHTKVKPRTKALKLVRDMAREIQNWEAVYSIQRANMSSDDQQITNGAFAEFRRVNQDVIATVAATANRAIEANERAIEANERAMEANERIATAHSTNTNRTLQVAIENILSPAIAARSTSTAPRTNDVPPRNLFLPAGTYVEQPPLPIIVTTRPTAAVVDDVSVLNVDGAADGFLASTMTNNNNNNSNDTTGAAASSTATAGFFWPPLSTSTFTTNNNNNSNDTTGAAASSTATAGVFWPPPSTTSTATTTTTSSTLAQGPDYRSMLVTFYSKHNNEKVGDVDQLLQQYKVRKQRLLAFCLFAFGLPDGSHVLLFSSWYGHRGVKRYCLRSFRSSTKPTTRWRGQAPVRPWLLPTTARLARHWILPPTTARLARHWILPPTTARLARHWILPPHRPVFPLSRW
jgi:hypothetical protein